MARLSGARPRSVVARPRVSGAARPPTPNRGVRVGQARSPMSPRALRDRRLYAGGRPLGLGPARAAGPSNPPRLLQNTFRPVSPTPTPVTNNYGPGSQLDQSVRGDMPARLLELISTLLGQR